MDTFCEISTVSCCKTSGYGLNNPVAVYHLPNDDMAMSDNLLALLIPILEVTDNIPDFSTDDIYFSYFRQGPSTIFLANYYHYQQGYHRSNKHFRYLMHEARNFKDIT